MIAGQSPNVLGVNVLQIVVAKLLVMLSTPNPAWWVMITACGLLFSYQVSTSCEAGGQLPHSVVVNSSRSTFLVTFCAEQRTDNSAAGRRKCFFMAKIFSGLVKQSKSIPEAESSQCFF